MDYILQFNAFREARFDRPLSHSAIVLYLEIFHRFNRNMWVKELKLPTKQLIALADVSENQFYSARAELIENGYITHTEGCGSKPGTYALVQLYPEPPIRKITYKEVTSTETEISEFPPDLSPEIGVRGRGQSGGQLQSKRAGKCDYNNKEFLKKETRGNQTAASDIVEIPSVVLNRLKSDYPILAKRSRRTHVPSWLDYNLLRQAIDESPQFLQIRGNMGLDWIFDPKEDFENLRKVLSGDYRKSCLEEQIAPKAANINTETPQKLKKEEAMEMLASESEEYCTILARCRTLALELAKTGNSERIEQELAEAEKMRDKLFEASRFT